jgi:hypothetical protein
VHKSLSARVLALLLLGTMTVACGGEAADVAPVSNWEHTTSTEGNVTTVNNTAGSKWGGDARLVEELSIGQMEGADEYAFGMISGIWPTEDRVYVSDARLDVARAYDLEGNFLFTIGATGQGPGEYEGAAGVIGFPDGRIAVHDGQKLIVYGRDGEYQEAWGNAENSGFRFMGPGMYAVTGAGDVYLRKMIMPEEGFRGMGSMKFEMRQALPSDLGEGIPTPSFDYEQPTHQITMGDNVAMMPVPFSPQVQSVMMPDGGFAAGVPEEYSFEIRRPDGSVTVVQKYWEPAPVNPGELEMQTRQMRIVINGRSPEIDWSGMDIPATKPAYSGLVAARDGRVFVQPSSEITVNEECLDPDLTNDDLSGMDCTTGTSYGDVFDGDGSFLGRFEVPDGANFGWGSYIDGDAVWLSFEDDLGTVMVKRYRLVAPRDPADS